MENNFFINIKQISRLLKKNLVSTQVFKENNHLTHMIGLIIGYVYNNQDKEIYQKNIEQEFNFNKSTASEILQTMEENNFITREINPNDRRLKRILLTENAKRIHEKVILQSEEISVKALAGLTEEEKMNLFSLLSKVKNNLEGDKINDKNIK